MKEPVTEELTDDGTITDLPTQLRACPTCGLEFFVEAVTHHTDRRAGATFGTLYQLRCSKGHTKIWVQGAPDLRDSK